MLQRDLQHDDLHSDHDASLNKQCGVKTSTEPVEDFEKGCGEHNEWDVEGEAGGRLGAVDAIYLVCVGRQRRDDQTLNKTVRTDLPEYNQPEGRQHTIPGRHSPWRMRGDPCPRLPLQRSAIWSRDPSRNGLTAVNRMSLGQKQTEVVLRGNGTRSSSINGTDQQGRNLIPVPTSDRAELPTPIILKNHKVVRYEYLKVP